MLGTSRFAVNLRHKSVEHAYLVPGCNERVHQMGPNETRPARDQDLQRLASY